MFLQNIFSFFLYIYVALFQIHLRQRKGRLLEGITRFVMRLQKTDLDTREKQ